MQKLHCSERLTELMERWRIDLLIAYIPENVYYLTGHRDLMQWLMRGRSSPVLATIDTRAVTTLVSPSGTLDPLACDPPIVDRIIRFGEITVERGDKSLWRKEDAKLDELVLQAPKLADFNEAIHSLDLCQYSRIGCDSPELSRRLSMLNSEWRFVDCFELFLEARRIKTQAEIKILRRATAISESSLVRALSALRVGMTEDEFARLYMQNVVAQGARPHLTTIGFGTFGAYPNHVPGRFPLAEGQLVRMDVGCQYKNYVADIARVGCWGKPSRKLEKYWQAVRGGQLASLAMIRPGVTASDIFAEGMRVAKASGIPHIRRHHIGHGIGLDLYERPMISPTETLTLSENMVFNLEVVYYELGFGGLQVEDTLLVRRDGYESFTSLPRTLFSLQDYANQ